MTSLRFPQDWQPTLVLLPNHLHLIYFDQTGGQAPAILKRFSVFFLAR